MQITVKLFANFRLERFKVEERDYSEGSSCLDIVLDVGITDEELGILLVNGRHAPVEQVLNEGDTISLFPLVGGG